MSPPCWKVSSMLLGERGGQLLIAPERTKLLAGKGPSHSIPNDTTLWRPSQRRHPAMATCFSPNQRRSPFQPTFLKWTPTVWDAEVPGKATNLLPVQSLLNPMLITHARDSDTWGPKRYPTSNNQVLKIWAMTLPFGQFICVRQKPTLGPWKESPCLQQFCL